MRWVAPTTGPPTPSRAGGIITRHGVQGSAVVSGVPDPRATTVVTSAAVELVASAYVRAHVEQGDFEQLAGQQGALVAEAPPELLSRYFGADFSLGTSLVVSSVVHGWESVEDLLAGVTALGDDDLVAELLASTTLEPEDRLATAGLVTAALAVPDRRASAARRIARRNAYRLRDVEHVLADPARARREVLELLRACASAPWSGPTAHEAAERSEEVRSRVARDGRERALLDLTGGWTVRSDAQPVVLLPTEALGPLVITRLLPDRSILVAFGRARRGASELSLEEVTAVARALGSDQRVAILRHVAREPASGQTLARMLHLTGATTHYHTALLRSCGLITSTRHAHSVLHALDEEHLARALRGLGDAVLGGSALSPR